MSEAVRAAQEKLLEIRRSRGIDTRGRATSDERRATSEEAGDGEGVGLAALLQSGRAYHSETLANHLRAAAKRRGIAQADTRYEIRDTKAAALSHSPNLPLSQSPIPNPQSPILPTPLPPSSHSQSGDYVKVYPSLALGMLRRKKAAAGRVWLLLRHADAEGRGRVAVADAARALAADGSPLRVCGRRQLANLLRAGEGQFWERDTDTDGREWLRLYSAVRVAAGLGVARLGGSPVAVPLGDLTGTIGRARAHLYASFHSGRDRADLLSGGKRPRGPIARATLTVLSGAAPNSQRNYERRARVVRHSAVAVGPRVGAARDDATDEHEAAWRRGRALFRLTDHAGRFGRPGATYLAWQLPNEYTGPHATLPRGRQKRLNRALADLFHDGMTGNDEQPITNDALRMTNSEAAGGTWQAASGKGHTASGASSHVTRHSSLVAPRKRFYANGKAADRARHDGERYWRYGTVWLWQPEIREIRTGAAAGHLPPAAGHPHNPKDLS